MSSGGVPVAEQPEGSTEKDKQVLARIFKVLRRLILGDHVDMGGQGGYPGRFWSLCGCGQCLLDRRMERRLEMSSGLRRLEGKTSWVIREERIPGTRQALGTQEAR